MFIAGEYDCTLAELKSLSIDLFAAP